MTNLRAALYLRRSTNEELQADSLIVQEEILRKYAAAAGITVVDACVFSESKSGRHAESRRAFSNLIELVDKGPIDFDCILVRDVSRWGRFDNIDESAYYEYLCFRRGVSVIYVEESFGGDASPFASLLKSMKRVLAAEFSRDKSRLVAQGQLHAASLGFWRGGPAPYGLRRVLVTPSGEYVQDMPRGTHKIVSNLRIRLVLGPPNEIAVVRRVFDLFNDGNTFSNIAKRLNDDGVPGPLGGTWKDGFVRKMLSNEAYIGTLTYQPRARPGTSEAPPAFRAPHSFPAIVEESSWTMASNRRAQIPQRCRTKDDLIHEVRVAVEKWGRLDAKILRAATGTNFAGCRALIAGGCDGALEVAYADEIAAAKGELLDALQQSFAVERVGDVWMLDDLLAVGFKVGWPRTHAAHIVWYFSFTGSEPETVTLCVGLGRSTGPELFFARTDVGRQRKRLIRAIDSRSSTNQLRITKNESLAARCRTAMFHDNPDAERLLLRTANTEVSLCISTLAKRLGWDRQVTQRMCSYLLKRGEILPPRRTRSRKLVLVRCADCGAERMAHPAKTRHLKTSWCKRCWPRHNRSKRQLKARCPICGRERLVWPAEAKTMKAGLESLCHQCAMAKGRATRRANIERDRPLLARKREVLRGIAHVAVGRMLNQKQTYNRPTVVSANRCPKPTIRWTQTSPNRRCALILDCTTEFLERCQSAEPATPSAIVSVADAVLDRSRWLPTQRSTSTQTWDVLLN